MAVPALRRRGWVRALPLREKNQFFSDGEVPTAIKLERGRGPDGTVIKTKKICGFPKTHVKHKTNVNLQNDKP